MSKTVAVYYAGIPPRNTNLEKRYVLEKFAQGVRISNDAIKEEEGMTYYPTDLAVIQGWVHENSKGTPHLNFRNHIITEQARAGKHTLAIDSNLFLYRDPGNTQSYLRFSLDGIFPTTGCYFNNTVTDIQWNKIKRDLNIDLKPWKRNNGYILLCLQRNGGWSMKGLNVMQWMYDTVGEIRKYTNRDIIVRGHPGDRAKKNYLKFNIPGVYLSRNENILDDFSNAWATVTYNSSPGVASAIEGVPVFVTDPEPRNSQAYDVANLNLADIEKPLLPQRDEWIKKISMSHFSFNDVESGEAWKIIKEYL